jgi:arylsulfatase A-like enzyme
MLRSTWIWLLTAAALGGAAVFYCSRPSPPLRSGGKESGTPKPNVVLISIDTLRPDHLGCYGYHRATSPNLDRLAREGVRFAQVRCQMPFTMPSHMSLFTSTLPSHNTVDHFDAVLPTQVPTLAELLKAHGYTTAALVNDAQMGAQCGFNRGFGLWREFPDGKPEGNCEHLTAEALAWLETHPAEPFFLFLHYYDPHSPYDPPPSYREAFGSNLSADQTEQFWRQIRRPEKPMTDRGLFEMTIASYDGEIAWVDHELGKLFGRLPDNTLVVVFSDHGEAFKEHGWWGHGGTVYEEEIRTALILHHRGLLPEGRVVDEPVMLLDVAPTILSLCGIQPPPNSEGTDLSLLWQGSRLPDRFTLAEVKSELEGRVLRMAQVGDWKMVYSLFDGKRALYRLPDEKTDRSQEEPVLAQTLSKAIRSWVEEDDYWLLYAHGKAEFSGWLKPVKGRFASAIVIDDFETDRTVERVLATSPRRASDLRSIRWICNPRGKTWGYYFQLVPREAALWVDAKINGKPDPAKLFLGAARTFPARIPWQGDLRDSLSSPAIEKALQPPTEGIYLFHHRGNRPASVPAQVAPLHEKTLQQLKSLGYVR